MTTPADTGEEEFSELVDGHFPRMDLVGKAANGVPRFLIAKQDAGATGLLEPGFVRELIAKAEPGGGSEEQVTMTGSPAAIAKLIHEAAQRPPAERVVKAAPVLDGDDEPARVAKAAYEAVVKEKYSAEDRRKMAGHEAMQDGSYPVKDEDDLDRAIKAVGRGGADHDAIRRHVIARAKAMGKSSKIPDNWASDGSLKEKVSKQMGADLDDSPDGMDPLVPLAAPEDGGAPGDPTAPGSPAWEAVDAATAAKWTSILGRARIAVDLLAEREMLEAATGDSDDPETVCDLHGVCDAIDYAISVLAPFAVGEQLEADCAAEELAGIAKAMASADDLTAPLTTVEAYALVAKAGRVLSAVNEQRIRSAASALQEVLQTLPAAPVADDQVAKEAAMAAEDTQPTTDAAEPEAVTKAEGAPAADAADQVAKAAAGGPRADTAAPAVEPVAKADGGGDGDGDGGKTPQVAVYDADGNLVGIVDPDAITPLQGAKSKTPADDGDMDGAGDLAPAPPAAAGTPADGVAKAAEGATSGPAGQPASGPAGEGEPVAKSSTTDEASPAPAAGAGDEQATVLKSIAADLRAVTAALDAREPAEGVTKADVAALTQEVTVLKERLTAVENEPGMPKVFANGQVPPPGTLRGQDRVTGGGAQQVDVAKARELKDVLYHGTGPEQAAAAQEMQGMAVEALASLHASRRG